jgi:hypothetical protein
VIKRPLALADMEMMFRCHVRHGPRAEPKHLTPVGPMDAKDAALLETPKIKAMLSDSAEGEGTV